MKRNDIFNRVLNALYSCLDEYGETLETHFSHNQLKDFANTITAHFPEDLEYKLNLLESEIFDNIPDKETFLLSLLRTNLLSVYNNIINSNEEVKEEEGVKSMYLLFFLSGRFLTAKKEEDIDMLFHKMIEYFNSFKINKFELNKEVKDNLNSEAITIKINEEESIRLVNNDYKLELVPTNRTRTIFKYLL